MCRTVPQCAPIPERALLRTGGQAITSELIAVEENGSCGRDRTGKLLNLPFRESVQAWERLLTGIDQVFIHRTIYED